MPVVCTFPAINHRYCGTLPHEWGHWLLPSHIENIKQHMLWLFFLTFSCFYRTSLRRESRGEGRYRKGSKREEVKCWPCEPVSGFAFLGGCVARESCVILSFHSSPWCLSSVFMCALGEEGRLRVEVVLPCVPHNDHHLNLALGSVLVSQPNPDLQRLNLPCHLRERTHC